MLYKIFTSCAIIDGIANANNNFDIFYFVVKNIESDDVFIHQTNLIVDLKPQ